MPQLAIETYITQYFWLVLILFTFYYISATKILPKIAEIMKTRKKLETSTVLLSKSDNLLLSKTNSLFSDIFTFSVPTPSISASSSSFQSANTDWISSILK